MSVDVDVSENLDSKNLNVREAPRRTPISAKMMKQLTELGMEDAQE